MSSKQGPLAAVVPIGRAPTARVPGRDAKGQRALRSEGEPGLAEAVLPLAFQLEFLAELGLELRPDRVLAGATALELYPLEPAAGNLLLGELREEEGTRVRAALSLGVEDGVPKLLATAQMELKPGFSSSAPRRALDEMTPRHASTSGERALFQGRLGPFTEWAYSPGLGELTAQLEVSSAVSHAPRTSTFRTSPHTVDALLRLASATWFTWSGEDARVTAIESVSWHRLPRLPERVYAQARLRGASGRAVLVDVLAASAESVPLISLTGVRLEAQSSSTEAAARRSQWQAWTEAVR